MRLLLSRSVSMITILAIIGSVAIQPTSFTGTAQAQESEFTTIDPNSPFAPPPQFLEPAPPTIESTNHVAMDLSAIEDWNAKITLPYEEEDFQATVEELESMVDFAAIGELERPTHSIRSPEVLDFHQAPEELKEIIFQFPFDQDLTEEEQQDLSRMVQALFPQAKATAQSSLSKSQLDSGNKNINPQQIINVEENSIPVNIEDIITADLKEKAFEVVDVQIDGESIDRSEVISNKPATQLNPDELLPIPQPETFPIQNLINHNPTPTKNIFNIPTAHAQTPNPVITYYQGIEKHPIDNFLYQLTQIQNTDGSFGEYNKYYTTARVLRRLAAFSLGNNDQYTKGLAYLQNTTPTNNL